MKSIYLDYAAATPVAPAVLKAMEPYFTANFYNPSATYLAARDARQALENYRHKVAQTLGARPGEIIFTAGATEANNLAIQGVMKNFPNGQVLTTVIEHDSVLAPTELFKQAKIPVDEKGMVKLNELEKMVGDKTVLVSVSLVNNELGVIQPLAEISKILNKLSILRQKKDNDLPLYLHSDVAQATNFIDLNVARLGVDLLSLNGGKIYGPKQSGALYTKAGIKLAPIIAGGGQEFGMRSGTENVAFAAGLATALSQAQNRRKQEVERLLNLRENFEKKIKNNFPTATINGHGKHRAPHIVSVTFPDIDNERVMMELDERGVQVALGSACSASNDEPSHVLKAIGLNEQAARSSLRFSFGRQTTRRQLDRTIALLVELINP